jgi:hypothetical protein
VVSTAGISASSQISYRSLSRRSRASNPRGLHEVAGGSEHVGLADVIRIRGGRHHDGRDDAVARHAPELVEQSKTVAVAHLQIRDEKRRIGKSLAIGEGCVAPEIRDCFVAAVDAANPGRYANALQRQQQQLPRIAIVVDDEDVQQSLCGHQAPARVKRRLPASTRNAGFAGVSRA